VASILRQTACWGEVPSGDSGAGKAWRSGQDRSTRCQETGREPPIGRLKAAFPSKVSMASVVRCASSFTLFRSPRAKASGFAEKMAKTPTTAPRARTGMTIIDRTPSCRQTSTSTRESDSVSLHHCDICDRMAAAVRPDSVLILTPRSGSARPAVARQIIAPWRTRPMATPVAPVASSARAAMSWRTPSSFGSSRIAFSLCANDGRAEGCFEASISARDHGVARSCCGTVQESALCTGSL
jgi:hypothetical protein